MSELTGAAKGERAPDRRLTNRNGYRERRWDTRVGTIDLAIPKVRDGSYFPSLLEPRRRAERALLPVVQEAYVAGGATDVPRRTDVNIPSRAATGVPVVVMDGLLLKALRTAACWAVGARYPARRGASRIALIGACVE